MSQFGDALISPNDQQDIIYENRAYSGNTPQGACFPDECDQRAKSPMRARDQNSRGTCAAFVGSTIVESQSYLGLNTYMSPEFIYHHRATKPGKGMFGRDVFHILQTIGCVPEDKFKYQSDDNESSQPDEDLYKLANEYRINAFARVETIVGLKLAMLNGEHTYLLLPSYNKNCEFWKCISANMIPTYHAVTVVGYNTVGFIFKNSWGDKWCNGGYGVFPYVDWPVHVECWVSLNDMKSPDVPARNKRNKFPRVKPRKSVSTFRKTS